MIDDRAVLPIRPVFTEPVLVAHVKHGYEDRRQSIESQLAALGIPFEFMLDGDIPDITNEVSSRWFAANYPAGAGQSCTCKHLLMYERIVNAGWQGALILEDDILLDHDFVPVFNATLDELRVGNTAGLDTAWISYENSTLRMPARGELRKGRLLYPAMLTRCTGAYYIGARAAEALLEAAATLKVDKVIDIWVNDMARAIPDSLKIYWCHPTVAEQGSMNGRFDSMDPRRTATLWRRVKWNTDKWYKTARHRAA